MDALTDLQNLRRAIVDQFIGHVIKMWYLFSTFHLSLISIAIFITHDYGYAQFNVVGHNVNDQFADSNAAVWAQLLQITGLVFWNILK